MNRKAVRIQYMAALWLLSAVACSRPVLGEVTIRLHARAVVEQRDYTLGEIADVHATTDAQRIFLSRLSLKPIPDDRTQVLLTQDFIAFRLVFAGWPRNQFVFEGPRQLEVRLKEQLPLSDTEVEEAAARTMQQVLGVERDELRVHLRSAFVNSLPPSLRKSTTLTVQVAAPQRDLLGQTTMDVSLWEGGQRMLIRTARFDVLRRHRVAVARLSMPRDAKITSAAFHFENRFLPEPMDEPAEEDLLGMKVLRQVQTGEIIQMKHLKKDRPSADQGIVIRRGDKVQATAINGLLHVRLAGAIAKEDGRIGQFISLTNGDREFSAQVIAAGQVQIRLR